MNTKISSFLFLAFLLTSCVDLKGSFDVKQAFTAKVKGGFLNLQTKELEITPALYSAVIKMSDSKVTIKINSDNKEISIPLKMNGSSIPSNGEFTLGHEESAQNFDVSGQMSTDVSYTEPATVNRSCSIIVFQVMDPGLNVT